MDAPIRYFCCLWSSPGKEVTSFFLLTDSLTCWEARRAAIIIVIGTFRVIDPEGVSFLCRLKFIIMPGTFSQIYIQIVFAVKGRENLIGSSWKTELHKYIAGIIKGKDQKPIM